MSDVSKNLKQIKLEVKKYKNTLVIDFDKVVLLLGYKKEPEDFYWYFESIGTNSKKYLSSCACNFIPLINQLNQKDYKNLYDTFMFNRRK